jgi:hypothetical protein
MSSSFGYLIPNKEFDVGEFRKKIIAILEAKEIIKGYYEPKYQWFAAGSNSHSIFEEISDDNNPAFEYVEIHDTDNFRIIPDCTSETYEAKCNECKADLDDTISEILMDLAEVESENEAESDMRNIKVVCSNCNFSNGISDIEFGTTVRIRNQFICFVDIESEFDDEKIKELSANFDCTFETIYGQM